jgi:hypothetical protein
MFYEEQTKSDERAVPSLGLVDKANDTHPSLLFYFLVT